MLISRSFSTGCKFSSDCKEHHYKSVINNNDNIKYEIDSIADNLRYLPPRVQRKFVELLI